MDDDGRPVRAVKSFARFPSAALPYATELRGRDLLIWIAYIEAGDNWAQPVTAAAVARTLGMDVGNVRRSTSRLLRADWMRHAGRNADKRTHPDGTGYAFAFLDYDRELATDGAGESRGPGRAARHASPVTRGPEPSHASPVTRGPEPSHASPVTREDASPVTRARPPLLNVPDRSQIDLPIPPSKDLEAMGPGPHDGGTDGGALDLSEKGREAARAASGNVRALLERRELGVYTIGHVAGTLERTAAELEAQQVKAPTREEWFAYFAHATRDESIARDPNVRNAFHVAAWTERVRSWLETSRAKRVKRARAAAEAEAAAAAPPAGVSRAEMRAFVDRLKRGNL